MRALVAPGAFKGTMSPATAGRVITATLSTCAPSLEVDSLVLADGGEGTLDAFAAHFGVELKTCEVNGPLGVVTQAKLGFMNGGVALIESCQAIGYSLVRQAVRNPFIASSFGLGQLINYAIARGARTVIISTGDSATLDVGVGMLAALGVEFFSATGERLNPGLLSLGQIATWKDDTLLKLREQVEFLVLVDTAECLCGPSGQIELCGPQKGLQPSDIPRVESSCLSFCAQMERHYGLNPAFITYGTGSGGVAAALKVFLGAELMSTLGYLGQRLGLPSRIGGADVVITGEGCLDNQTKLGKLPYYVASHTSGLCICIAGRHTAEGYSDLMSACPSSSVFTLNPEKAEADPENALRDITFAIGRTLEWSS